MNVVGEGFPKEIITQVYNRQRAYGSGYSNAISRTPEEILYLNANSSWCKLISSTNIENINVINNPTIKNLNLPGDQLARQFILFNGTANGQGLGLREGIDLTNSLSGNNKAYGIGGTEFGIRPMMGIQTVSVTHENRGSLRQASVKLKAWNRTQFEIIDVLYLRLGFSVLLEWGNSMYFDNNYVLQTKPNNSLADEFLNGNVSYKEFLSLIEKKRLESLGNYDAMFAKVKNFSWSFQKDGSYDITLDLISSGDVIESLKINAIIEDPLRTDIETEPKPEDEEDDDDIIDYYVKKSSIGQFLYYLKYQLTDSDYRKEGSTFSSFFGIPITKRNTYTFSFSDIPSGTSTSDEDILELSPQMFEVYDTEGKPLKVIDAISYPWDDKPGDDEIYYVRFGTFLAFIQNYLMPKCNTKNNETQYEPILNVDYDQNTNLMYAYKWQVTVDPRICIVGRTISILSSYNSIAGSLPVAVWQQTPFQVDCSPFINDKFNDIAKGVEYGNIMNIYISMRFILEKIDSLKDDKNKVSLFDLIKGLCESINEGLGGLNALEPIIDETSNIIKIIDTNPLPNRDKVLERIKSFSGSKLENINTELVSFDLYGYKIDSTPESAPIYNGLGHASFIKDFSFATEITPEFATMVTVGAAANGSVVGENQTALSKLNVGLTDRYKKEVLDIYEIRKREREKAEELKDKLEKENEELNALTERYEKTLIDYFDFLEEQSDVPPEAIAANEPTLNVDEIDAHKGTLLNIVQYEEQIKNKIQNKILLEKGIDPNNPQNTLQTGTGFIPFNLSITMDGLSGMKIYSKFIVDASYLPSNYPNNVEFLIKGINHEIADNKWTTKLESFCISTGNFEDTTLDNINSSPPTVVTNTPSAPPPIPVSPIPAPDWSKYNVGATPLLKRAVTNQSTYVYSKGIYAPSKGLKTPTGYGEIAGRCAGYTYNIAYKLKDYINSNSKQALSFVYSPAGNANQDIHRQNIVNLGIYDMYYLGDYKASELKSGFISRFKWNYGDILNYYAPGYSPPHNMHSQMYTGDIWKTGINSKGTPNAAGSQGWSTSGATNYGAQFVYKSSNTVFKVFAFKIKPEYLK